MQHNPRGQLVARDLTIERDGTTLLRHVDLTLAPGDRIGLVGPNGSGKSSLLAALAGHLPSRSGAVTVTPPEASIGLSDQELRAQGVETVAEYVARVTGVMAASAALDVATEALAATGSRPDPEADAADPIDGYQQALDRWLSVGADDLEARLGPTLAAVGLEPGRAQRPVAVLSGGEGAKVGLAALLLARHDILLLDEPTNNLDRRGLELLESHLLATDTPILVVSHDRAFMTRVVTAVVELDPHRATAVRYDGGYDDYLRARSVAADHERRRYDEYVRTRQGLEDRARRQREWAVKGVKAERRPPDNDRAARGTRIDRTEKQAAKARTTERALERLDEVDKPWEPWELRFAIGQAERSGQRVAELDQAVVARGEFVLGPVSLLLTAGERVGIVGDNGSGKTTLVRAWFGRQDLTGGSVRVGPGVRLGWLDQDRLTMDPEATALTLIQDETGLDTSECRSVLAKFGLSAEHLSRPTRLLSPGERTRVVLAGFQARGVNTLVLDEPTNHLDLPAILQVEQAAARFVGTLVLVTHDRAFLEAVSLGRRIDVDGGQVVSDTAAG